MEPVEVEVVEEDILTLRLEQLRLVCTIALIVVSIAVTIDQMNESVMLDNLKARWEAWKAKRRRDEDFRREFKRVLFDAYRTVSEVP